MSDCDVISMLPHELVDHRRRVGVAEETMMRVGAYYDAESGRVMDTEVLCDWIDRLQDWSPDAVRKAFWAWQDQKNPAHLLHILRDTYGRSVVAEAAARLPRPVEPPRQIFTAEARERILKEVGGLPERVFKTFNEIMPSVE